HRSTARATAAEPALWDAATGSSRRQYGPYPDGPREPSGTGCAIVDAVEPVVSLEQLEHLLALEHESEQLDYKRGCDLKDKRAIVELAKDVAAMQIAGGYIVIGADDRGRPVPPGVLPGQERMYDEANLRPKLSHWLSEPFELRTAVHPVEDCTFALIYVVPREDGFCIFSDDGKYHDGQTEQILFRKGEVFVRHGTVNERWRQTDIDRIRKNLTAREKQRWRAELREELIELGIARDAQLLITGPAASFTWRLDTATFDSATLELFRRDDDIPLQRLLNEAATDAAPLIDAGDLDELGTLVGRVTSVAAQAIAYRRLQWFDRAVDALATIYRLGFDAHGLRRSDDKAEDLWLIVIEHLLGLGALAVRQAEWRAVRTITVRPPGERDEYYPTWLRHGLTMAARGNKFGSGLTAKSLVTLAAERVVALPALRPDVATEDERLVTSICQFDILAALTIIGTTGRLDSKGWYTNFARFYSSRSEPIVQQLLHDEEMRAVLFPRPDADLASALREIDRMAASEGVRFSGWQGFCTDQVRAFLGANAPPAP
ncbi:MAG: ATP-binding protein, partial [Actinobacteria bacterium]|nr:ATP-binding protein [Actinomycetota bacterium]